MAEALQASAFVYTSSESLEGLDPEFDVSAIMKSDPMWADQGHSNNLKATILAMCE